MKTLLSIIAILTIVVGCSETTDLITDSNVTVSESDEEANLQLTQSDIHDSTRGGARLILSYNTVNENFQGTVQNTTTETLSHVRIEVHLSNGVELGPTTPIDLPAGRTATVTLNAVGQTFDKWSAHAEVGGSAGEGAHGGETAGEHGGGSHN